MVFCDGKQCGSTGIIPLFRNHQNSSSAMFVICVIIVIIVIKEYGSTPLDKFPEDYGEMSSSKHSRSGGGRKGPSAPSGKLLPLEFRMTVVGLMLWEQLQIPASMFAHDIQALRQSLTDEGYTPPELPVPLNGNPRPYPTVDPPPQGVTGLLHELMRDEILALNANPQGFYGAGNGRGGIAVSRRKLYLIIP